MWSVQNSFCILFLILLLKNITASHNGVADLLASVAVCTCGRAFYYVNLQRQRIRSCLVSHHCRKVLMLGIEEEESTDATLSHLQRSASESPILFFLAIKVCAPLAGSVGVSVAHLISEQCCKKDATPELGTELWSSSFAKQGFGLELAISSRN